MVLIYIYIFKEEEKKKSKQIEEENNDLARKPTMCLFVTRRLGPAYASTRSDQSHCCLHEEKLDP